MAKTQKQIKRHVLNLDAQGKHETDAKIGKQFNVTGRRVGQIRSELYQSGKIDVASDFAPQSAKREAGREILKQNPQTTPKELANKVGVTVSTARQIRKSWEFRKEVEWQRWMKGESLFPYSGSKAQTVGWILWKAPEFGHLENPKRYSRLPDHKKYVEVFAGSATVLFNKEASESEVLNDGDPDVAHFFEILRDHGKEIQEFLDSVPFDRERYDEWVRRWEQDNWRPKDDVKRAAVFLYGRFTQNYGKVGGVAGFNWQRSGRSGASNYYEKRDRLPDFQERLEGVDVENQDYEDVLRDHDGTETLFYLDPPYVGKEGYYSEGEGFDHDHLVELLKSLDGRWILSYGKDLPDGLDNYRRERMDHPSGNRDEEHLVMNYEPGAEGMFDPTPHGNAKEEDW